MVSGLLSQSSKPLLTVTYIRLLLFCWGTRGLHALLCPRSTMAASCIQQTLTVASPRRAGSQPEDFCQTLSQPQGAMLMLFSVLSFLFLCYQLIPFPLTPSCINNSLLTGQCQERMAWWEHLGWGMLLIQWHAGCTVSEEQNQGGKETHPSRASLPSPGSSKQTPPPHSKSAMSPHNQSPSKTTTSTVSHPIAIVRQFPCSVTPK